VTRCFLLDALCARPRRGIPLCSRQVRMRRLAMRLEVFTFYSRERVGLGTQVADVVAVFVTVEKCWVIRDIAAVITCERLRTIAKVVTTSARWL
jgi:hypothetical protein